MSSGRPRIDVLLPVRGARRTLPSALGDLLAQRGVDVRVIAVVDAPAPDSDAATAAAAAAGEARERRAGLEDDASLSWLQQRARSEPRLTVLAGPGRGPGAALDLALSEVQTECFAHMEADDRCAPDRLARLHAALHPVPPDKTGHARSASMPSARRAQLASEDADAPPPQPQPLAAVVSRAGQFGARTAGMRRYLDWQNGLLTHADMAAARFLEIPALHQTGLYRSAAVRAVGGYVARGPWPLDIDFWLRWFEHDALRAPLPVLKLPRALYRWRQHALQSTRAGAASGGSHAPDALRACKAHYIARLHGRRGAAPRPLLLLSTGRTLETWHAALRAQDVDVVDAVGWRPGEPLPAAARSALQIAHTAAHAPRMLAAYGMQPARTRLAAALFTAGLSPAASDVLWAG